MKTLINRILNLFNIELTKKSYLQTLISDSNNLRPYKFLSLLDESLHYKWITNLRFSKSQLQQDLFVLSELGFKRDGFFVEFGATNGIDLSNTYMLETQYKWKGILAEPAKIWHSALKQNRSVAIETDCLWHSSDENLLFHEVSNKDLDGELSTIGSFTNADRHASTRRRSIKKYNVNTISLEDLLAKHQAPREIDYLSIDTEGSEFEILNSFDFSKHNIKIITCEHNFTPNREKIYHLLSAFGYQRKYSDLSLFDDWYVKED